MRNISSVTPHEPLSAVVNQFLNLEDVKSFYIYESPKCFYIPFGIEKHFQNLETLFITHSGLKSVTNEDLKPFPNLKGLYMHNNQIESLGKDFFMYNLDLQEINLSDNKLKNVAFGVFEPLMCLEKIEMFRNPCIDMEAITEVDIEILTSKIQEKCPPKVIVHKERSTTADSVATLQTRVSELEDKLKTIQLSFKGNLAKVCEVCDEFRELIK